MISKPPKSGVHEIDFREDDDESTRTRGCKPDACMHQLSLVGCCDSEAYVAGASSSRGFTLRKRACGVLDVSVMVDSRTHQQRITPAWLEFNDMHGQLFVVLEAFLGRFQRQSVVKGRHGQRLQQLPSRARRQIDGTNGHAASLSSAASLTSKKRETREVRAKTSKFSGFEVQSEA